MSSPVLTRLGINQFWYNHWISDKNYSSSNQLNHSILIILEFFVNYGLTKVNNSYVHEYWYNRTLKKTRTLPSRFYMHYYKRHFYTHDILGIEHTFLIRHKTGEYFPFKTWYMSYNNWIILAMHWYKPNKKKRRLNPMVDHNHLLLKNNLIGKVNNNNAKARRTLLAFALNKNISGIQNYAF